MSNTANTKIIYFALYEGVQLLDVAGPAEVFSLANAYGRHYDIRFVSNAVDNRITSSAGLNLHTNPLPRKLTSIHTLIVPGAISEPLRAALADNQFVTWLAFASRKATRLVSVCTGAFFFGALGLLDNRRATTHWLGLEELQRQYPKAIVEKDTLYTNESELWTSAGVLSGVDMALAIVAEDLGPKTALAVARELVVFVFRDGGQSQFSGPIDLQTKANRSDLVYLVGWLESNLRMAINVEKMAEYMAVSVRTLHRRCQKAFGMTPAKLFTELRLEHSRNLLQEPMHSIKQIAHECGYPNSSSYSKAFSLRFGVAPQKYRLRFRV